MSEFLHYLRFWLIAALFLGVSAGALLREWPGREGPLRWLAWTGLAALAGLLALAIGAVQSPPGLYLAAALAAYVAYVLGAAFGAMAAGGDLRAHDGWALGLLPLALLWGAAAITSVPDYLRRTEPPGNVARPDRGATPGPAGEGVPDAAASLNPYLDCRRALDAAMAAGPLRFQPGRVAIHASFALALDAAASVIRGCPPGDLEVSAQADAPGPQSQALARRRAEAVARYLNREGLDQRRAVVAETDSTMGLAPGMVRLDVKKF
jgi:outer membrane protein OmpA-like peptidoglycan-associated protein